MLVPAGDDGRRLVTAWGAGWRAGVAAADNAGTIHSYTLVGGDAASMQGEALGRHTWEIFRQ